MNGGLMHIGSYADGRPLNYDETAHSFDIGGAPVSFEDVAAWDDAGQVEWLSEELRAWARTVVRPAEPTAQGENAQVDSPKRGRLFGFRSHRIWKMILACAYYALCVLLFLGVFASVRPYGGNLRDASLDVFSYVAMVLALLSPAILLSDFSYRDRLPLFRQRKVGLSVLGLAAVFLALIVASAAADSMHSESYKRAAAAEQAARRAKAEAEDAARRKAEQEEAAKAAAADEARRAAEASAAAAKQAEEASAAAAAKQAAEAQRAAEASAAAAKQAEAARAAATEKRAKQAAVVQFEKDVYALEGPAQSAIEDYQATMTKFSNGTASIYDAYSAAHDAKSACESARMAYWDLDTPSGLPDDVSSLLRDVKSELSTSYGVRAEAFEAVMEFLDTQKPSSMQKFKDKVAQADSFTMQAVAKLLQAKEKMGIPLSKP